MSFAAPANVRPDASKYVDVRLGKKQLFVLLVISRIAVVIPSWKIVPVTCATTKPFGDPGRHY